jgi:hypothetical protein
MCSITSTLTFSISPTKPTSAAVEPGEDVRVDLAEQDHLGDLDRFRIGDAQALDELHLHAHPLHVVGDLGAAAMDDDRVHPDVLEEDDVPCERLAELLVAHRRAAVLDDDRAPVELPDVRERLEKGLDG